MAMRIPSTPNSQSISLKIGDTKWACDKWKMWSVTCGGGGAGTNGENKCKPLDLWNSVEV